MNTMTDAAGKVQGWAFCRAAHVRQRAKELLQEESAQGTTEYAILLTASMIPPNPTAYADWILPSFIFLLRRSYM